MAIGPEHKLQIALKRWTREHVPHPHVFMAFDRSRRQSPLQHIAEKNRGLRSGCPDCVLLHNGAAIWTELKAPDGVVSIAQKELHAEMDAAGFHVSVVRSVRAYAEDLLARHVGLLPLALERADAADRLLAAPGQRLGKKRPAKPFVAKPSAARMRKAAAVRGRVMF